MTIAANSLHQLGAWKINKRVHSVSQSVPGALHSYHPSDCQPVPGRSCDANLDAHFPTRQILEYLPSQVCNFPVLTRAPALPHKPHTRSASQVRTYILAEELRGHNAWRRHGGPAFDVTVSVEGPLPLCSMGTEQRNEPERQRQGYGSPMRLQPTLVQCLRQHPHLVSS